jgi:hypothetical protein
MSGEGAVFFFFIFILFSAPHFYFIFVILFSCIYLFLFQFLTAINILMFYLLEKNCC